MTIKRSSNKKKPKYVEDESKSYINDTSVYSGMLNFKRVSLTSKQNELSEMIKRNKIIICTGPPGSSKSFSACYTALNLFNDKSINKILLCKPTEIVGDTGLGYLKGDLNEKLEVYKESFVSIFNEIIEERDVKMLFENLKIEFKPVQFIRGATYKNCILLVDEFQSFDMKSLMAIVTRLGKNCKMVFIGDVNQSDINKNYVAVDIFKELLNGIEGIEFFEFERKDIVRDPILIEITDRYEKMKAEGKIPNSKGNK